MVLVPRLSEILLVDFFPDCIEQRANEFHRRRIRTLAFQLPFPCFIEQAGSKFGQGAGPPCLRHLGTFFDRSPVLESIESQREWLNARPDFLERRNVGGREFGVANFLGHDG